MKSIVGLWTLISLGYAAGESKWHTPENGSSYFIEYEWNYSWLQASDECSRMNMSLMTVDSMAKQREIYNLFGTSDVSFIWLGAHFNEVNKSYEWVATGKPLVFTNWANGGLHKYTDLQCVRIHLNRGYWYNTDCSYKYGFICEGNPVLEGAILEEKEMQELKKSTDVLKADVLVRMRLGEELKELKKTIADLKTDVLVGARLEELLKELKRTSENLKVEIIELKEQKDETCENLRKLMHFILNIGSNKK